jgi:UDP-N-acetylmuramate-alanine ligase
VRGSDRELTDLTKALAAEGIQVCCPQSVENIAPDTELVIYNNLSFSDV